MNNYDHVARGRVIMIAMMLIMMKRTMIILIGKREENGKEGNRKETKGKEKPWAAYLVE